MNHFEFSVRPSVALANISNSLIAYPARKYCYIVVISFSTFKCIKCNNDILVDRFKILCVSFILAKILHQSIHPEFLVLFVYRFRQSVGVTKEEEVTQVCNETFIKKGQRMHRT